MAVVKVECYNLAGEGSLIEVHLGTVPILDIVQVRTFLPAILPAEYEVVPKLLQGDISNSTYFQL